MAEKFEQKFELDSPLEIVWAFLTDPYQIVACLSGAAITNKIDQRTYEGTITVKVGLMSASYAGKVTFEHVDPVKHETRLAGIGQDTKGKGSAEMKMVSRLRTTAAGKTEVVVNSEMQITGLFAQMGRGMIDNVADQMLRQFTAALKQKLDVTRTNLQKSSRSPVSKSVPTEPTALHLPTM
ncbi:MAG: SRPBCC family protein [Candidatus Binatia bacterium]